MVYAFSKLSLRFGEPTIGKKYEEFVEKTNLSSGNENTILTSTLLSLIFVLVDRELEWNISLPVMYVVLLPTVLFFIARQQVGKRIQPSVGEFLKIAVNTCQASLYLAPALTVYEDEVAIFLAYMGIPCLLFAWRIGFGAWVWYETTKRGVLELAVMSILMLYSSSSQFSKVLAVIMSGSMSFLCVVAMFYVVEANSRTRFATRLRLSEATQNKKFNDGKLDLIAAVAHDFRAPLQSFKMGLGVLSKPISLENREKISKELNSTLCFMEVLCTSLLVASTDGIIVPNKEPTNVRELFDETSLIMRNYGKYNQIPIQFEVDEDIPDFVLSDRRVLWCGLINMLSNARKYTYSGKIVALASLIEDPQKPGEKMIRICIADTGVGVNDDKRVLLFKSPYCQLQRNTGGIGLGLYSASVSIFSLGGRCEHHHLKEFVDTFYPNDFFIDTGKYKCGSVFTIEVPFVPIPNTLSSPVGERTFYDNQKSISVLIVDDDAITTRLMRNVIENIYNNVVVTEACNGAEALNILKNSIFDVVFCDVVMPTMDGYECVRRLREFEDKNRPEKRQYICGLSGNVGTGHMKQAIEAGMDTVCFKPIDAKTIERIIFHSE